MILLKNAEIYSPKYVGIKDILIAGNKIVAIKDNIEFSNTISCEIIDCKGLKIAPGFIDSHVHIAGAGGEGGPATRTPEIQLSQLIEAGVTTVIGCLGTDGMTRNIESVLMKVKSLRVEGISSWMYTGSYQVPTPTITGDVGKDIALIEEIIGVGEIAISDHRSSVPTINELIRLAGHARVGGMLGNKAGIVNIHLGDLEDPFRPLYQVVEQSMLKLNQFLPTHCNRNDYTLNSAIEYAKAGGFVDFTTSSYPYFPQYEIKPSKAVKMLLNEGISIDKITFSSDGCGSLPDFDAKTGELIQLEMGLPSANHQEFKDLIFEEELSLEVALKILTENPARILKLQNKGKIEENKDADIILFDEKYEIKNLISNGILMMKDYKVLKRGAYER